MAHSFDSILLDQLEEDPETPSPSLVWYRSGFKPTASQTVAGFMVPTDKTKLDNMSANGSGDDWISGLAVTAHTPNDQTVDYTAGTYMVNGVIYSIASGGSYDLENGYGAVDHYAALAVGQRAIVLLYADTDEALKSVAGAPTSAAEPPLPALPEDTVFLEFVTIRKHTNGSPKNIVPPDLTDCRYARKPKLDELVKVSATDTTSGFLASKLSNNGNVHFTKENTDTNETLKADVQFGVTSVTATSVPTTSSASYVPLDSMTITPDAGTYALWFSTSISHTTKGSNTFLSIFSGGSQIVPSETGYTPGGVAYLSPVSCLATVTVNGSQTIEVRWKTNAGTASCYGRTLLLMKVG